MVRASDGSSMATHVKACKNFDRPRMASNVMVTALNGSILALDVKACIIHDRPSIHIRSGAHWHGQNQAALGAWVPAGAETGGGTAAAGLELQHAVPGEGQPGGHARVGRAARRRIEGVCGAGGAVLDHPAAS